MQSRWNDTEAANFTSDPVALRAYTSRLLGQEPALVQHGGGNTSVKVDKQNLFGETESILFVKGSGWDLATIQPQGFAPVNMETLLRMARLEHLSDSDMVRAQRAAMTNPSAPTPSVEAILHAIIPFQFVDHTHSDAVVTLTNTPTGEEDARALFGDKVLILPYVMPGFVLARQVYTHTRDLNWRQYEAVVLLNHGIFTFHDQARTAYENMIRLVSKAEEFLRVRGVMVNRTGAAPKAVKPVQLAEMRRRLSEAMGAPVLLRLDMGPEALGFADWQDVATISARGTVTPDHVIHIKPKPLIIASDFAAALENFTQDYRAYFEANATDGMTELDPCPRWAVWPGHGCLSIARSAKNLRIVEDISSHTRRCMQWGEALGGWKPVAESELFAVEYWELEQAKLKVMGGTAPVLQGKVALVTGAASGIGKAIAFELKRQGACVAGLDLNPGVVEILAGDGGIGVVCDVTSEASVNAALEKVVAHFGGVDILVSNAGTFPPGKTIEEMSEHDWTQILNVNLSGHWRVMKAAIPLLKLGFEPTIVVIGSKNVAAPGPGASAYSTAKAGLTQLARVAALELAPFGVRVNTLHPDAVFDTGIWSEEVIAGRAKHYGLSVEHYKKKNLLKTEVTSKNVADLVAAMVGPGFAKTTGAQIPIDGGNDRVI